jgi:hypothetical protein
MSTTAILVLVAVGLGGLYLYSQASKKSKNPFQSLINLGEQDVSKGLNSLFNSSGSSTDSGANSTGDSGNDDGDSSDDGS